MEFNTPITADQAAFLAANKEELCRKDAGKAVWQNRVKMASEAYAIAKGIHGAHSLTTLVERLADEERDDADPTFPDWPVYRDNFILDWIANRIVVTEEEADMIFDRTVDEALQQIEAQEQNDSGTLPADPSVSVTVTPPASPEGRDETTPVVKRRGRPPGSGKKTAEAPAKRKSYYVPVAQRKAKAKPAARKVAAKKKSGGSVSAKAQPIIERFTARKWSRRDILIKLQDQLEIGAAYAATLYQKFA